jgi:diguanylate cyclase
MQTELGRPRRGRRADSVTQSAVDVLILADSAGHILTWNRAARHIFSYEPQEALDQPLSLMIPERYRAAHLRGIERMCATNESQLS